MRKIINWNEDWYFSKGEKVQPDFSETWMPVTLPHTWNAEDGQDGGNDYWRGTACYAKAFKNRNCRREIVCFLKFRALQ